MKRSLLSLAVLLVVVVLAVLLLNRVVGPHPPSQSQLSRAACEAVMKRLHITDATALKNCEVPTPEHNLELLSTAPITWGGYSGTAVTIGFATETDTARFKGTGMVAIRFDRGPYISDLAVEVMKLEPRALTLFFTKGNSAEAGLVPEAISEGTLIIIPCEPNKVCG